jgi:hypothetical protein
MAMMVIRLATEIFGSENFNKINTEVIENTSFKIRKSSN